MLDGFLSANRSRDYPFTPGATGRPVVGPATLANLPRSAVVDCGFLAGPRSGYEPASGSVYLASVVREGDALVFVFVAPIAPLAAGPIVFVRHAGDPPYATEHADSGTPVDLSESLSDSRSFAGAASGCAGALWSGFLVTGPLDDLLALLPPGGVLAGSAVVEPTLVQSTAGGFVGSINVANDDRTRATPPDGCAGPDWPYPAGGTFLAGLCLTGDVAIVPGYNATARRGPTGALVLGAAVGAGRGEPCAAVPLFPGESSPEGSPFPEGGPACAGLVRSVNGLGGPALSLTGGPGVAISADPAAHTVTVAVATAGTTACLDESEMP